MLRRLKHSKVRQASQIRASIMAEWTRRYGVRVVQYLNGHKYVSSTERYEATNLEDLQEQLRKFIHCAKLNVKKYDICGV